MLRAGLMGVLPTNTSSANIVFIIRGGVHSKIELKLGGTSGFLWSWSFFCFLQGYPLQCVLAYHKDQPKLIFWTSWSSWLLLLVCRPIMIFIIILPFLLIILIVAATVILGNGFTKCLPTCQIWKGWNHYWLKYTITPQLKVMDTWIPSSIHKKTHRLLYERKTYVSRLISLSFIWLYHIEWKYIIFLKI